MRLSEKDFTRIGEENLRLMDDAILDPDHKAMQHPYYWMFREKCQVILLINEEAKIAKLWTMLLRGYSEQGDRVETARANAADMQQYLQWINDNRFFVDFVEEISRHCPDALAVTAGKELALWTGGYQVSQAAQELGFCTLERTKLGGLFHTLPVTRNWNQEEALWNIFSKKFAELYQNGEVHIYFRNVDELCVLFQQEIPMLKVKNPAIPVIWHPLVTSGGELSEIGYIKAEKRVIQINLRNTNSVFCCMSNQADTYKGGFQALEQAIRTASPVANQYALTHFRSKNFNPVHAPMAADGEREVGLGVNDFIRKFWV